MRPLSFLSLRASLLAALGLGLGCGGKAVLDRGSAGTGGGTSTGTGTSNGGGAPTGCADAVPVLATDGTDSGFARCPDGTLHRNTVVSCNPDTAVPACVGDEASIQCTSDADCTAMPHGRCAHIDTSDFGGPTTTCDCAYPCATDAECGAGKVCVCAGVVPADNPWSACAPATCVTGQGCASGECGISSYPDGCSIEVNLACRSSADECRLDTDCTQPNQHCVLSNFSGSPPPDLHWQCESQTCAIGRPLLVGGAPRTAQPVDRDGWSAAPAPPSVEGLDAATREALARHWLEVAALEHASVASFARFTLHLLALGAPAALVAEAQRAGLDEVDHAALAYAFAGAYAGRRFGPGALDLGAVEIAADRRAVLRALIEEACVGETLGVAEALSLAATVRDPAIRAAHARIAADEQRHAELAWRTLAWLLDGAGQETLAFATRCFDEAAAAAGRDPQIRDVAAPDHGVLAASDLGRIRRQALREVVRPCAAAALAQAA